jgi:hypothetical protein
MASIPKPSGIDKIWAASGDILAPSDTKISQGWQVEIPSRQHFNWIDNRQDQAIAHINQRGIPVWDSVTEYQANGSYVQGSDGVVYKALVTNTNINPVGTTGTWRVAFIESTAATGPSVASTSQAQAKTNDTTYISPLKLAQAFQGANQNLSANGYQTLPGGLIMQWGNQLVPASSTVTYTFPVTFPNQVLQIIASFGIPALTACNADTTSTSQFRLQNTHTVAQNARWISVGF